MTKLLAFTSGVLLFIEVLDDSTQLLQLSLSVLASWVVGCHVVKGPL